MPSIVIFLVGLARDIVICGEVDDRRDPAAKSLPDLFESLPDREVEIDGHLGGGRIPRPGAIETDTL